MIELRAALEDGDWPRALELALAAWRTHRIAELADLVDAIAARCPSPPVPHSKARVHAWWTKLAEAPAPSDIDVLLETFEIRARVRTVRISALALAHAGTPFAAAARLAERPQAYEVEAWEERLALLARWPDDPRVARALTRWLCESILVEAPSSAFRWVAERIGELADERTLGPLRAASTEPRGANEHARSDRRDLVVRALTAVDEHPPALDAPREAGRALLSSVAPFDARRAASDAEIATLFAECARDPDDLAPRLVLADALIRRGDPRGELIVLQCRPDARSADRDRAIHLWRTHWNAWLGDAALVLVQRGSRFERGMLEVVRVGEATAPPWAWSKLRDHRELGCVRDLRAYDIAPPLVAEAVSYLPRLPRSLTVDRVEAIEAIAERCGVLDDVVELVYASHWLTAPASFARAFELLAARLRRLETIEIRSQYEDDEMIAAIRSLPALFPTLARIRVVTTYLARRAADPYIVALRTIPLVELVEPRSA